MVGRTVSSHGLIRVNDWSRSLSHERRTHLSHKTLQSPTCLVSMAISLVVKVLEEIHASLVRYSITGTVYSAAIALDLTNIEVLLSTGQHSQRAKAFGNLYNHVAGICWSCCFLPGSVAVGELLFWCQPVCLMSTTVASTAAKQHLPFVLYSSETTSERPVCKETPVSSQFPLPCLLLLSLKQDTEP